MKHQTLKVLLQKAGISLLSAICTLSLFLLLNIRSGIFPCGENTVVWCDMEQQAVPLLMQLRQLWRSGESIAFSQLNAGGMHFYAVFFFFLSNPFSLLALFTDIPADQLVVLLVLFKLSAAAGTASYWFRSRIPTLSPGLQILLGIMYGCSGYGLFYYQNLMWLDVMVMLPLLMLSMRRLLKKTDPRLYLLTLSATVILNFYLSLMIVIFVVLYMAVSIRTTVPAERRSIIARRFVLASTLAACLTAFVWLPCLIQVMQSARGIPVTEVLKSTHLFDHLEDKVSLLGCTALGLAALPMLWQKDSPRISSRRRDRRIFLLLMFAALLDPINIMWHGGSYQAFPLRWGMIPILLMLTLAGKQLAVQYPPEQASVYPKRSALLLLGGTTAAALGFALYLHFRKSEYLYSYINTLWVSSENALWVLGLIFFFMAAYLTVITLRQHRIISIRTTAAVLAVLFLGEFSFHYDCYFGGAANPDTLFAQTVQTAEAFTPEEDTARVRLTRKYAHANMLGALGYPTLAHYTSLTRADFLYSMKRLGYSSYWMEVSSIGGTVLSDALWNVRYQLGVTADFPGWTEPIWTNGLFSAAHSNLMLPSALYTDADAAAITDLPSGSRITVQQHLAAQLLGLQDAVTVYQPTALHNVTLTENDAGETICTLENPEQEGEIRYSLFIPDREALYFDLYSQTGTELGIARNSAVSVQYNGRTVSESYPEDNGNGFVLLGEPNKQYCIVSIRVQHDFSCESFGVFGMLLDPLAEAMQNAEGTVLHYRSGEYWADCSTDSAKTLLLSAAYDEGFSAEVNGEAVPLLCLNGCQLGIRIPAGESHVSLRYQIPGLRAGMLLGGGGIFAALLLLLLRKRIPQRICKGFGIAAQASLQIGYRLLLLALYLLPMILWTTGILTAAVMP